MNGAFVYVRDCKEIVRIMREELPEILQQEPEPKIRKDIVEMICLLGGRGAANALISALRQETDWDVIEKIVYHLGEMLLETRSDNTANKIASALVSALSDQRIQEGNTRALMQERLRVWTERCSTKS